VAHREGPLCAILEEKFSVNTVRRTGVSDDISAGALLYIREIKRGRLSAEADNDQTPSVPRISSVSGNKLNQSEGREQSSLVGTANIGRRFYEISPCLSRSRELRRSLVIAETRKRGETYSNVEYLRIEILSMRRFPLYLSRFDFLLSRDIRKHGDSCGNFFRRARFHEREFSSALSSIGRGCSASRYPRPGHRAIFKVARISRLIVTPVEGRERIADRDEDAGARFRARCTACKFSGRTGGRTRERGPEG